MLEGPSARRKQIAHDEMRRELQRQFPKVDTGVVTDLVTKYFADEVEQAEVSRLLNEEQRKIVGQEFAADSGDTSKVVLYVTNQTNDRHLRYRCNRLRLSFVCLRLDYEEVDIAGNKWLREKLCKVAQTDELPLVFVGMGADGKFIGTYEEILNLIDEDKVYEHLMKFGYKHRHKRQKHFVFTGDTGGRITRSGT